MKQNPYRFFKISEINNLYNDSEAGIRKKWGQNFLVDPNIVREIAGTTGGAGKFESVMEIGPGLGALTHEIIQLNKPFRVFEIDPFLCRTLGSIYPELDIIEGDFRENLDKLPRTSTYVFGNLPYYITSELIVLILKNIHELAGATFLVQKEFADRIINEISSFSVYVSAYGSFRLHKNVKPGCFYPPPRVDSSILVFRPAPVFENQQVFEILELLLRVLFWGKRKKIYSSLKKSPFSEDLAMKLGMTLEDMNDYILSEECGINPELRPENMDLEKFYHLARMLRQRIK